MKVDKNIRFQELGKYVRLCVEVNLSKMLIAMFTIRDIVYKVEYKGFHLLSLIFGKFGHYIEGCGEKATQVAKDGDGTQDV